MDSTDSQQLHSDFPSFWLAGEIHQFDAALNARLSDLMVMVCDLFTYFIQLYFHLFK